jgi:hypothetical protein
MMRTKYLAIVLSVLACAGCKSTPVRPHAEPAVSQPADVHVTKVLAVWTDSVLREDDKPVAQGFTCKVYLMSAESSEPAAAPGEFAFYAFVEPPASDPAAKPPVKPEREWKFTASESAARLKKDPLGLGYSFWLPWGPPANEHRQCSLVVRYTPAGGQPVLSESTLVHLPSITGVGAGSLTWRAETQSDASIRTPTKKSVALTGMVHPTAER